MKPELVTKKTFATTSRRFRTEEEFKTKFGTDWRKTIAIGWTSPRMDEYFGIHYDSYNSYRLANGISEQMLTYEDKKIQAQYEEYEKRIQYYKERAIIKDGAIDIGIPMKTITYHSKKGATIVFWINIVGTGNCQVFYLMYFNRVLAGCDDLEILELLEHLRPFAKRIAAFDVKETYADRLKNLEPMWLQPYVSTNGSRMIAGQFKLS